MTRRAAFATGLVVLALLVGGRWVMGRHPAETVTHQALGAHPSAQPPPPSASTSPAPAATKAPAPKPTTRKPAGPRPTIGPFTTKRLTGSRAVALTFDDGPHPDWTPKVLDELRSARVKATFCVVGTEVSKYPALVARIVREGHNLCNHTWHHELDLGTKPEQEIRANLEGTNRAIQRAVPGARVKFFRHPGGRWTANAVKVAREMGMVALDWDVDPKDWEKPGADVIRDRVLADARPGSIVLLHDGGGDRAGTLGACPSVVSTLKKRYGIVRLR